MVGCHPTKIYKLKKKVHETTIIMEAYQIAIPQVEEYSEKKE